MSESKTKEVPQSFRRDDEIVCLECGCIVKGIASILCSRCFNEINKPKDCAGEPKTDSNPPADQTT